MYIGRIMHYYNVITSGKKYDSVEVVSSAGRTRFRQFMSCGLLLYK